MTTTVPEGPNPPFYIADADGAVLRAWCAGPGPDGRCPAARPGRPVPCAGYEIVLACPEQTPALRRSVSPDATECPLRFINGS